MKKIFKLYWPMSISLLFLFIYGFFIGTIFYSDSVFQNNTLGLIILFITILLVIGIYVEMVYFMVKACKNKDIHNKALWCIGLYILNIFIFPYFNLKYIYNEKKNILKMIVFTILIFVSLGVGFFVPVRLENVYFNKPLYIIKDDVKIKFSGGFRETEIGNYDFYVKDRRRQINFGGFIYDDDDFDTPSGILESRDHWIKTSRGTVTHLDTITKENDDSFITLNIYIGTNNGIKNVYYISNVEFKDANCFVNTISTYLYDDYLEYKGEIIQILSDMEYDDEKEL